MNKVLKKYLKYNRLFWIVNINDKTIIKKGLTISTGWNLGKNIKSSHLFDPFTSVPRKGTNNKLKNETKNPSLVHWTLGGPWFKEQRLMGGKLSAKWFASRDDSIKLWD